jgi:hypothetical protein
MKTLQFETTLTADSNLKVPESVAAQMPKHEAVRVMVLLPENDEEADWKNLSTEQFLAGYSDNDAVYDAI